MARTNIDDKIWDDPRIKLMASELNEHRDRVVGTLARVWRQCGEFETDTLKKVYVDVTAEIENFSAVMIECELAEEVSGDRVRLKGVKDRIQWLLDAREKAAKAGKESGKKRRENKRTKRTTSSTSSSKKDELNEPGVQKNPELGNPPVTTLTLTPVTTLTPSQEKEDDNLYSSHAIPGGEEEVFEAEIVSDKKKPGSRVWDSYASAYFSRYNVLPVRNAKANSQCSQLVKRLGEEGAVDVVKFYLTHTDQFYLRRSHPLGDCLANAEGLRTQMLTGDKVTSAKAKQQEKSSDIWEAGKRIAAKLEAEERARNGQTK